MCTEGQERAFWRHSVTPVANQVIDWLSVALMAGGGVLIAAVLRWLSSKTKLQDNEFEAHLASRLNDILHRAIEHAVVVAKNEVNKPGSSLKDVKLDNFFLNVALNFAIARMPEITSHFKLDEESHRDSNQAFSSLDPYRYGHAGSKTGRIADGSC